MCSDCEAYGLMKHGLMRSNCIMYHVLWNVRDFLPNQLQTNKFKMSVTDPILIPENVLPRSERTCPVAQLLTPSLLPWLSTCISVHQRASAARYHPVTREEWVTYPRTVACFGEHRVYMLTCAQPLWRSLQKKNPTLCMWFSLGAVLLFMLGGPGAISR